METEETIYREEDYPGGILTRVAKSHLRVGTFEYAAQDIDKLKELVDYAIKRHYPELNKVEKPYFVFLSKCFQKFSKTCGLLDAYWIYSWSYEY